MSVPSEDRRRLTGKYAPEPGVCRVCGGKVIAHIAFQNTGLIGGPAPQGYISSWSCEKCCISYQRRPEAPAAAEPAVKVRTEIATEDAMEALHELCDGDFIDVVTNLMYRRMPTHLLKPRQADALKEELATKLLALLDTRARP